VATVVAVTIASAAHAIDLPDVLTGYAVSSWADGDGRPLGSVNAIAQDLDGYLWIGTDAGLVRFDGWRFARWETIGTASLPNSSVSALFVSADGTLWVGFRNDGAIWRIGRGSAQADSPRHDQSGLVADIAQDRQGTMWAVIAGRLYRLANGMWARVELPMGAGAVVSVATTHSGSLLVGTTTALFEAPPRSDAFHLVLEGWAWDVSEDARGALWVTDTSLGFKPVGGGSVNRPRRFQGNGYRLLYDSRDNLWIATIGEGLWRARLEAGNPAVVEKASLYSGLLSDSVQSIIEDREGNVWVGTTGGLHKLTERKVTPIVNIGLAISVEVTGAGGIWAGTGSGLVKLAPAGTGGFERLRLDGSASQYVRTVHRDREGTVWVGSNQGLFRVADSHLEPVSIPSANAAGPIAMIGSDAHGTVWLSDGVHLLRWNSGRFASVPLPFTGAEQRISLVYGDSAGRVWIALTGGRLMRLDDGIEGHGFQDVEALRNVHRSIYDIVEDSEGVVWVLGNAGLSRLSGEECATLKTASGLPASRIGAIAHDLHGYIWLNIDPGLIRFSRDSFSKTIADPSTRLQYELYDASDGVAGAPILNVRAKRGTDGLLWFVRGGGLTSADPRVLLRQQPSAKVPVHIEEALVDDNRVAATEGVLLPAGTRRVQINYAALTLRSPSRIRFRHRLEGFDADWIDAGSRRQAFYTNLPPRSYTFRVEATADDITWNSASTGWNFGIKPMFYQSVWFYFVCAVSVALAAAATWQFRVRLMRHEFSAVLAERTRLAREIHDTLLQNMIGVALQFDALADSIGSFSADARHTLVRARKQVEGYIRDARQSIWDLRSPSLERRELATALREIGKRATREALVEFDLTTAGPARQCPTVVENALLRIGQEAITNAVRHSQPSRIAVELFFDADTLTLRVRDNGCGFDPAQADAESNGHYGLMSMRERAEDIEAAFTISSTHALGTVVEAVVALDAER